MIMLIHKFEMFKKSTPTSLTRRLRRSEVVCHFTGQSSGGSVASTLVTTTNVAYPSHQCCLKYHLNSWLPTFTSRKIQSCVTIPCPRKIPFSLWISACRKSCIVFFCQLPMDTETWCGLPSTGKNARLLIGTAY